MVISAAGQPFRGHGFRWLFYNEQPSSWYKLRMQQLHGCSITTWNCHYHSYHRTRLYTTFCQCRSTKRYQTLELVNSLKPSRVIHTYITYTSISGHTYEARTSCSHVETL